MAKKRGRRPNADRSDIVFSGLKKRALAEDIRRAWWEMGQIKLASPGLISSQVGCSRQAIYAWRKEPFYRKRPEGEICQKLKDDIVKGLTVRNEKANVPDEQLARIQKNPEPYLDVEVRKRWPAPTISPLDGRLYNTPDDYLRHLVSNKALFTSMLGTLKVSSAG